MDLYRSPGGPLWGTTVVDHLMVANTAFGATETLPFDLRNRRIIPYAMPDENVERAPERNVLQRVLEEHMRAIINHAPRPTTGSVVAAARLDPEARFIRDNIATLVYELRQASAKQFRGECVLMAGEKLGPQRPPMALFALTPESRFTVVQSLHPLSSAFAAVYTGFLFQSNPPDIGGRRVKPGYEKVFEEYSSLLGKPWVISAYRYKDDEPLTGDETFNICLYGLRAVDDDSLDALVRALDVAEGKPAIAPTADAIASEIVRRTRPSAADKAQRHQLRNEIADLIQRGRLLQANVIAAAQDQLPELEKRIGKLLGDVGGWHMQVLSFTERNISHADAMRLLPPTPSTQYPQGVQGVHPLPGGNGIFNVEQSWDFLAGDIAALQQFLVERPEL